MTYYMCLVPCSGFTYIIQSMWQLQELMFWSPFKKMNIELSQVEKLAQGQTAFNPSLSECIACLPSSVACLARVSWVKYCCTCEVVTAPWLWQLLFTCGDIHSFMILNQEQMAIFLGGVLSPLLSFGKNVFGSQGAVVMWGHLWTSLCSGFSPMLTPLHACMLSCFIRVRLFVIPWTVARQAPLSMGFPRQEYWSGLHFLLPGIFQTLGSNPCLLRWQADSLPLSHVGSPILTPLKEPKRGWRGLWSFGTEGVWIPGIWVRAWPKKVAKTASRVLAASSKLSSPLLDPGFSE